jgi:hypothetical protein
MHTFGEDSLRLGGVMAARRLTVGQRALLLVYCTDHAIASCGGCGREIALADLFADLWTDHPKAYDCPRCATNVAEAIQAHLGACPFIAEVSSSRTRQIVDGVKEAFSWLGSDDGETRPSVVPPLSRSSGLVRCAVCRRGVFAASDIAIRDGQVVHLACDAQRGEPAAS